MNNGSSIKFWQDFWLSLGPMRNLIEGPLSRDEEQLTVQQCFDMSIG